MECGLGWGITGLKKGRPEVRLEGGTVVIRGRGGAVKYGGMQT